jgi:hypothetical protein
MRTRFEPALLGKVIQRSMGGFRDVPPYAASTVDYSPCLIYSALGSLRQGPLCVAESSARART